MWMCYWTRKICLEWKCCFWKTSAGTSVYQHQHTTLTTTSMCPLARMTFTMAGRSPHWPKSKLLWRNTHTISLISQCKVRGYARMIFHLAKGKNLKEIRALKLVIIWIAQNYLCRMVSLCSYFRWQMVWCPFLLHKPLVSFQKSLDEINFFFFSLKH